MELKRLLEAGANPNTFNDLFRRRPPLSEAARQGHLECVQVLIGAGADVHVLDRFGWNALHFAAYRSDGLDTCLLLIQMGVDTSIKTRDGQTALDLAFEHGKAGKVAMIEGLIKARIEQEQIQAC